MTGREILTALTDIDEEYIEEAAKKHKSKKNIIIRFSAMRRALPWRQAVRLRRSGQRTAMPKTA